MVKLSVILLGDFMGRLSKMYSLVDGYLEIPPNSLKEKIARYGCKRGIVFYLIDCRYVDVLCLWLLSNPRGKVLCAVVAFVFHILSNYVSPFFSKKFLCFTFFPEVYRFWVYIFNFDFYNIKFYSAYYTIEIYELRVAISMIVIMMAARAVYGCYGEIVIMKDDFYEWLRRKLIDYSDDSYSRYDENVDFSAKDIICSVIVGMKEYIKFLFGGLILVVFCAAW